MGVAGELGNDAFRSLGTLERFGIDFSLEPHRGRQKFELRLDLEIVAVFRELETLLQTGFGFAVPTPSGLCEGVQEKDFYRRNAFPHP